MSKNNWGLSLTDQRQLGHTSSQDNYRERETDLQTCIVGGIIVTSDIWMPSYTSMN